MVICQVLFAKIVSVTLSEGFWVSEVVASSWSVER